MYEREGKEIKKGIEIVSKYTYILYICYHIFRKNAVK